MGQTIYTTLQIRRDTTENWILNKDVVLAAGEPSLDIDTGVLKIGNGRDTYENLPPIGSGTVEVDGTSIEVIDGKLSIKGANNVSAGQQLRIGSDGKTIEWYTPDSSTIDGLTAIVSQHTSQIGELQTGKADKASTLAGYGITDAMTSEQTTQAIQTAISESGHAVFQKVDEVPDVGSAQANVLYLVMNAETGFYDIYAKVGEEVVRLDDTSVNLDAYSTTEEMNQAISTATQNKVDKEDGKGLSTNDFTNELKQKLDGIADGSNVNVIEIIKINDSPLQVAEDKSVNIPLATASSAGIVQNNAVENGIEIGADGKQSVKSLNVSKLVQTAGTKIILDCGSSSET